jgi:two-component system, OmpR family, phosphate regulon response regulator PhoB
VSANFPAAVRSIVYQFGDPRAFRSFILASDRELALPLAETVADGEWVLAIFEIGKRKRATAAAARGIDHGESDLAIVFEERDWSRILAFAEAAEISLSGERAAAPVPLANDDEDRSSNKKSDRPKPIPEPSDTQVSRIDEAIATPSRPVHGIVTRQATSRVLLVEDDSEMAKLVRTMLEGAGLTVESSETAEFAYDRVMKQSFDLVILDWNLPGMNGVDLCKKLRKEKSLSQMPILFLTGHASSKDVVEAFGAGADDFVSKPFRAPELNARILGLLRRARVSATSFEDDDEDDE